MTTYRIGYIVGSLSANSINRKLALALKALAPANLEFVEVEIKDLPLYNHDLDGAYPAEAVALKDAINASDALLYVTPEYNRSIPGALKNAIDWASRPWGQNSLGKPSAVVGASIGAVGTAVAQQHLKGILNFSDAALFNQPEVYLQFTEGLITETGEVTNEGTAAFLKAWLEGYAAFVAAHVAK
ncbi:NAD(P)H-dependent oxidoreductase [Mycetocola lacteus]|uniref:NAD(P)H-dependent oxidoreductase n=1 Tax=Mycetocola lacteus TaxID=76637 RepID=A0A3L7AU67_9MICO|nr:NADPH-dependent FMN reductase [Mycetocola lacteus]RLP84053.1 NAD(P)H-dependent oxidoreductase [Mycetocola lacteus]